MGGFGSAPRSCQMRYQRVSNASPAQGSEISPRANIAAARRSTSASSTAMKASSTAPGMASRTTRNPSRLKVSTCSLMSGVILPILRTCAKRGLPRSRPARHLGYNSTAVSETGRIAQLLARQPPAVSGPFYVTLHGHIQHGIYHAGQIAMLQREA